MKGDSLGDRMKDYEKITRSVLPPHTLTIIRVDGRAFHTYLKLASKPFDFDFVSDMQSVAEGLCREVSGTVFAYGQSDEISLIISDMGEQTQPWFGGVVQKMVSVAASAATAFLVARRGWICGIPQFDARVFTVPSWVEAANYVIWRQLDAVRNSISMAAQAVFTPAELHGKRVVDMQLMLANRGIDWNSYPDAVKCGWVLTRAFHEEPVTFTHKRSGEEQSAVALRTFWEVSSPPLLTIDSPLFAPLREGVTTS